MKKIPSKRHLKKLAQESNLLNPFFLNGANITTLNRMQLSLIIPHFRQSIFSFHNVINCEAAAPPAEKFRAKECISK